MPEIESCHNIQIFSTMSIGLYSLLSYIARGVSFSAHSHHIECYIVLYQAIPLYLPFAHVEEQSATHYRCFSSLARRALCRLTLTSKHAELVKSVEMEKDPSRCLSTQPEMLSRVLMVSGRYNTRQLACPKGRFGLSTRETRLASVAEPGEQWENFRWIRLPINDFTPQTQRQY